MAGMTSIYVGVSGLQSAQTSLNTTSHNLANIYTPGYTRQLSFTGDKTYCNIGKSSTSLMQVGLGVTSTSTSRVRAILLDQQYRKEIGRENFYNAGYQAVSEIETIIGETEGVKFQDSLENLWSAINEMSKTPGSAVSRSELVMCAETFIDRAKSIYNELGEYQKNVDKKVIDSVNKINELGDKINQLNLKISGVETAIEDANDLRDQRDLALDQLSELVKITYDEDENHYVNVKIEGVPFITEGGVYHMATAQIDGGKNSSYLSCIWPQLNNQEVFNLEEKISTANNNDMGSLKGFLLARGDFTANYTDVPNADDYDLSTAEGKADYQKAVDTYNATVDCCIVTKTQALFDKLIHNVVTKINDVFSPTVKGLPDGVTTLTDSLGNVYDSDDVLMLDMTTSTGDDGVMPPEELFSRDYTSRFIEVTGDDGNTYYMYNNKNVFGSESNYTLSNINMNQVIVEDYTKLPFKTKQGDNDLSKGAALVEEWNKPQQNLDPSNLSPLTFKEYYRQMIYTIGNTGDMFYAIAQSQAVTASQVDDARTQITGVSSEEELTNMIRYQSAYNASSRYITTVSDMLQHLIEKLG